MARLRRQAQFGRKPRNVFWRFAVRPHESQHFLRSFRLARCLDLRLELARDDGVEAEMPYGVLACEAMLRDLDIAELIGQV